MTDDPLDRARKAAALYDQGKNFAQIGAMLGMGGNSVRYWLQKVGVQFRQKDFKTRNAQQRQLRRANRERQLAETHANALDSTQRHVAPKKDGNGWHVWTPERQFREPNR